MRAQKKRITAMLVEHVFGEFRQDLHHIRQCLAMCEYNQAEKLVSDLYDKMFEIRGARA